MIKGPRISWVALVLLASLTFSCGTSPAAKFYTLESTATANGTTGNPIAVLVGPVSVPAAIDQPQFLVQVASNRVEVDEFDRWAAPLSDNIARALAGDLATLMGTPNVAVAPLANFDPDYTVTVEVQRFDSIRGQAALVDAIWIVRKNADGTTHTGRTLAREAVEGDDSGALAAAHSRALARLSGDVAATIRADASSRPD